MRNVGQVVRGDRLTQLCAHPIALAQLLAARNGDDGRLTLVVAQARAVGRMSGR
jgi:hypothetical protein